MEMKLGNFTEMAKYYEYRVGYDPVCLEYIRDHIRKILEVDCVKAADVGAGTGKLTETLIKIGVSGYAVEPNDAMRQEGMKAFEKQDAFIWSKGCAEKTNLPDHSVDWVLMGDSFHWTDAALSIPEFKRILKQGGFFTAIWKPRNILSSELHQKIEDIVYRELPNLKRVSAGNKFTTDWMRERLGKTQTLIYMETDYEVTMSTERYMNIWRSVNDIQVQAGEETFAKILKNIEQFLGGQKELTVPYKTKAWTARF